MIENIPTTRKVLMKDAAHLANMDHPEEFRKIVENFLKEQAHL
jgi:pimeloyl-ACP methyl ester carboxylesterase